MWHCRLELLNLALKLTENYGKKSPTHSIMGEDVFVTAFFLSFMHSLKNALALGIVRNVSYMRNIPKVAEVFELSTSISWAIVCF